MTRLSLALVGILFAAPALAEEPATIILPTPLVTAMAQYLSQRPFYEVEQLIAAVKGCVGVQVPNAQGVTVSHGECPVVTAAVAPKPAPSAPAPTSTPVP